MKQSSIVVAIGAAAALLTSFGYQVISPNEARSALETRVAAIEVEHQVLIAIARLECLRNNPRDLALAGLNCKQLLGNSQTIVRRSSPAT